MIKISKKQLAANLESAILADVGMKGLLVLLYGWLHFRKYGKKYCHALCARNYLFVTEVQDFSDYAGYDLTKSHCDD